MPRSAMCVLLLCRIVVWVRPWALSQVARNLFGKSRDRALSDTDALFAPRLRRSTHHHSGGESPAFSTSSPVEDGFNWESSRCFFKTFPPGSVIYVN